MENNELKVSEIENEESSLEENSQLEEVNSPEFTDTNEDIQTDKKPRGEKNSNFARMRREKERKREEHTEDYDKGMLDAVDGINPFTGEKINDEADLNEYKIMREIAKTGGDPLTDYRKFVKDKSRKEAQETRQQQEQQKRYEDDVNSFQSKYPNKLKELTKDERFAIFAKGKVGKMPLVDIYEDFVKFNDFVSKDATEQAEKMYSNAMSSTGSLSTGDSAGKKGYLEMSDAEFEKVYQKALNGGLSKR